MTRSTKFTQHTREALRPFGDPTPTVPRGLYVQMIGRGNRPGLADHLLSGLNDPPAPAIIAPSAHKPPPRRRFSLRPTWLAVAAAGIVGTLAGALIAVLSAPVVGG